MWQIYAIMAHDVISDRRREADAHRQRLDAIRWERRARGSRPRIGRVRQLMSSGR
jgi:hypothetical protein